MSVLLQDNRTQVQSRRRTLHQEAARYTGSKKRTLAAGNTVPRPPHDPPCQRIYSLPPQKRPPARSYAWPNESPSADTTPKLSPRSGYTNAQPIASRHTTDTGHQFRQDVRSDACTPANKPSSRDRIISSDIPAPRTCQRSHDIISCCSAVSDMQSARYRVATKPTDASPYTKDTTLNGHTTLSTDRHPLDNGAVQSREDYPP